VPRSIGYLPNALMWVASTGATKLGTGWRGSPTDRLIIGLPGSTPVSSSVSRTKGERTPAGLFVPASALAAIPASKAFNSRWRH
jgi:hypothetical protein